MLFSVDCEALAFFLALDAALQVVQHEKEGRVYDELHAGAGELLRGKGNGAVLLDEGADKHGEKDLAYAPAGYDDGPHLPADLDLIPQDVPNCCPCGRDKKTAEDYRCPDSPWLLYYMNYMKKEECLFCFVLFLQSRKYLAR